MPSITCSKCQQTIFLAPSSDGSPQRVLKCPLCGAALAGSRPRSGQGSRDSVDDEDESDVLDAEVEESSLDVDEFGVESANSGEEETYGIAFDSPSGTEGSLPPRRKKKKKLGDGTGAGKPAGKKKKKSSNPTPADGLSLNPAMLGGVAAAGLFVLGIGIWALIGRGNPGGPAAGGNPANANAQAEGPELTPDDARKRDMVGFESHPITLSQPFPGVQVAAQDAEVEVFTAAPAFDEATAATRLLVEPAAYDKPPTLGLPKEELKDEPRWQAENDPAPDAFQYEIAPKLSIPLDSPGYFNGEKIDIKQGDNVVSTREYESSQSFPWGIPPTFSSPQGPYALIPPRWEKMPYVREWSVKPFKKNGKEINYRIVEEDAPLVGVVDLRTGEKVGEFDWRIPFHRKPILSPDGQYVVGPYHVAITEEIYQRGLTDEEKSLRQSLFVWKRKPTKKPVHELKLSSLIEGMSFVTPTTIAVVLEDPRQLQVWDVTTGKKTGELALGDRLKSNFSDRKFDLVEYLPDWRNLLAVSPGGKYAAVMTPQAVLLISLGGMEVVGQFALDNFSGRIDDCKSLQFLPDGDALSFAYLAGQGTRLVIVDLADGRRTIDETFNVNLTGPVWVNADRKSAIYANFARVLKQYTTELLLFDRPYPVTQPPTPIVLQVPERGAVVAIQQPPRDAEATAAPMLVAIPREEFATYLKSKTDFNIEGLPHRPPLIAGDRSGRQVLTPEPPADWQPLPKFAETTTVKRRVLGRVPFPATWSENTATILTSARKDAERGYVTEVAMRTLPLEPDAPPSEPVTVLPWAVPPGNYGFTLTAGTGLPIAANREGTIVAVSDPEFRRRVDLWSGSGEHQGGFEAVDDPLKRLVWLGFSAQGQLLALSDGALFAWDVSGDTPRALYKLDGGYTVPAVYTPDRTLLMISRGGSFDFLEPSSGKVLNRCQAGVPGVVFAMDISPDGRHVASLHVTDEEGARLLAQQGKLERYAPSHLALWDLTDGSARILPTTAGHFGTVSWLSNDHLLYGGLAMVVYDLRLQRHTVEFTFPPAGASNAADRPVAAAPDRTIWYARPEAQDDQALCGHSWHIGLDPRAPRPELEPFLSPDRSLFIAAETPIELTIDLGDEERGRQQGEKLIKALQAAGYKIGPGGAKLRIHVTIAGTGEFMNFTTTGIEIPCVNYHYQLTDAQGTEIFKATSSGRFLQTASKYYVPPDLEQRRTQGGDTFYDFGLRRPLNAITEEILDDGRALGIPTGFPRDRLVYKGKYFEYPLKLQWYGAE